MELELFAAEEEQALLATVYAATPAPPEFGDTLLRSIGGLNSVCWIEQPGGRRTTWGSKAVTYRVGEYSFRVSHDAFFQTNRFLHERMIQEVVGEAEGARALDLFAGVGFFALPLARRFGKIAAVESQDASARDLAANVAKTGRRARAHHKTAEGFLAATSHNWDLVVVNPPRSGLSKTVCEHLRRLAAPRLVYVSCDPTTLARDLARLTPSPYQIRSVCLVDQFPQTFHIETVVHLERAG